jgi:hypothetical protein
VTFAPLIVADTRVGVTGEVGDEGGIEPHEMEVNDNTVDAVSKRPLQGIDCGRRQF